jgi:glycosyltransferase involved in cell wall biosynthesis
MYESINVASIDVAIPCYQYGRYLRECVTSVFAQDVNNLRVLIIDNGSTDNTLEVAQKLAANDPRVEIVVHEKNIGAHAAFNAGIDWARATYFMILAADDLLAPGALSRGVSILEQNPDIGFAIGPDIPYVEGKQFPKLPPTNKNGEWQVICGSQFIAERCNSPWHYQAGFLLVRTTIQKEAGYYRASLPHTDDLEMLLRLASLGRVATTNDLQGIRREHGSNQLTQLHWENGEDARHRIAAIDCFFANQGRLLKERDVLRRVARRRLAEKTYWSAVSHLARGHGTAATALFKVSFELRPATAACPPISYLFHMEKPVARVRDVISEAILSRGKRYETTKSL